MPVSNDRKIISLAALSEFKTNYDAYVSATFVPYANATKAVNLGSNNFTVRGVSITQPEAQTTLLESSNTGVFVISAGNNPLALTSEGASYYLPNATGVSESLILATKADISTVYRFMGSRTVTQINSGSNVSYTVGNTYNVTDTGELTLGPKVGGDTDADRQTVKVIPGDNVTWVNATNPGGTGTYGYWDKLAGTVDLSNYYTSTQVDTNFVAKAGSEMSGALTMRNVGIVFRRIQGSNYDEDATINSYVASLTDDTVGLSFGANSGDYKFESKGESQNYAATLKFRSSADRAYYLPNEDGTLVVGEYATTGAGGDIAALFS